MAIDVETLGAAMGYTKKTIEGAGALEGAPCQIQSITPITGGNRVTFLWEDNEGEEHTTTMDVMNGATGSQGPAGKDGKDGKDGDDYVLTAQDKSDIADIVLGELTVAETQEV